MYKVLGYKYDECRLMVKWGLHGGYTRMLENDIARLYNKTFDLYDDVEKRLDSHTHDSIDKEIHRLVARLDMIKTAITNPGIDIFNLPPVDEYNEEGWSDGYRADHRVRSYLATDDEKEVIRLEADALSQETFGKEVPNA